MQSSARRRRYRPQLRRSCARQPPHQTPCSLWYALNSFAVDSTFVSCMPSGPMHAFVRTAAGRAGVTAPHVLTIGPFSAPLTAFFKATSRWCRSGASRTRVGAAGALHKYQISCFYFYFYFYYSCYFLYVALKLCQPGLPALTLRCWYSTPGFWCWRGGAWSADEWPISSSRHGGI